MSHRYSSTNSISIMMTSSCTLPDHVRLSSVTTIRYSLSVTVCVRCVGLLHCHSSCGRMSVSLLSLWSWMGLLLLRLHFVSRWMIFFLNNQAKWWATQTLHTHPYETINTSSLLDITTILINPRKMIYDGIIAIKRMLSVLYVRDERWFSRNGATYIQYTVMLQCHSKTYIEKVTLDL